MAEGPNVPPIIDPIEHAVIELTVEACAKRVEAYAMALDLQRHMGLPDPVTALLEAARRIREMKAGEQGANDAIIP